MKKIMPVMIGLMVLIGCALSSTQAPSAIAPVPTADARAEQPAQTPVLADNTQSQLNIPYGSEPLQKLDIYAPRGVSEAPVVIFVHGGEWARHDKDQVSYKPKFLNENGSSL